MSPNTRVQVSPLQASDHADWLRLAQGYKAFYESPTSDETYAIAWQKLMAGDAVHGLGARVEGQLVGFTHYLFHASTWAPRVCYLQDLFVDESLRGQGTASALIEAVAQASRAAGAQRLYWLTQTHNARARGLYDRVAQFQGFIRYEYPLLA
ncbi:GNAT family N-acetyltransferase [Curvibacter sp. HBC28]|uniref:GNAT family N-acetyltransferase n=1 Tax=Curvibacter microcysteis TaxID=3026419 RepID=A0ABT5MII9_9BURK|nr:GNAT family N-acetyltransferase [Curvibacter sp. HBC28]MDD0814995.1 GNAT family N-acetyltransferase [Curvibacter sp. HBC28]